jgi:hypothetical protein
MRALRNPIAALALAGVAAMASAAAVAGATVTYTDAQKFADMPFSPVERERVLDSLSKHFADLGKLLPAGQELKVTVTDIDLAGRIDYNRRSMNDIRVMRGMADWPRIELHYSLEEGGKVLLSGDAKLSDMNYLENARLSTANDELRYEKQMLDNWFSKTFDVKVPGARPSRG